MWDLGTLNAEKEVNQADYRIYTSKGRPYHRFSKEMKALIVKLYPHGYKSNNLAQALNCSTATITRTLEKAGVKRVYSRRFELRGSDGQLRYRLDPYDYVERDSKDRDTPTPIKSMKKVYRKIKIQFNRSYTRSCQLKIILEAFSCWIIWLQTHTTDKDWLDLACQGEKPP